MGEAMAIQQEQSIDLKDAQIVAWIRDEKDKNPFASGDPPLKPGFIELHRQSMGRSAPQKFSWAVQEVWGVRDANGQHVSTFEVHIPCVQEVTIETISVISVSGNASQAARDAILDSFGSYDPASGIDPHEWARKSIPADDPQGFGLFDVRQKYRLEKAGAVWSDRSAFEAIRDRIDRGGAAEGPQKYACFFISDSQVSEVPEPSRLVEERLLQSGTNLQDPAVAKAEIDQIVVSLAKPAECDALQLREWREKIGDLLTYPEFMIRWELVHVRIGCVEVALHLPILYTRSSTKQLWVFGYFPNDPLAVLSKIVESCALLGAGAGVVAGLVFSNLAAAIAAFKHVFLECFKSKVTTTVRCVIPGLALLTATENWRRA